MSSNKTTNYQLHLWEPEDDFIRSEFNENNEAIDAALAALSDSMAETAEELKRPIAVGSYTGDGATTKTLTFSFAPQLVVIVEDSTWGSLLAAVRGQTTGAKARVSSTGSGYSLVWGDNSLTLTENTASNAGGSISNASGSSYYYFAAG